jgi:uncharacterized protein
MRATLNLTHRCNLACRYCYSGRPTNRDMSLETAQRCVDFAFAMTGPGQRIDFGFFGGEPLLCFELMRAVTTYIHEHENCKEHPLSLSVTTNGTLLTESMHEFLQRERVSVCVSIDGPARVHDLNRVYQDGRGSFVDVQRNLQAALARLQRVQVNAVYGPETARLLPETVSFLLALRVPVIHLNADIQATWTEETVAALPAAYAGVADLYVESYRHGQEVAINLLDSKMLLFLKGGYSPADRCAMGEREWGFAPSGNIYPCERFIGEDGVSEFCLGNVHTGLDKVRQRRVIECRGNRNPECIECAMQVYCMNWCGCTNYHMTGQCDQAGRAMCVSEKAAIQAARKVFLSLHEQDNELFVDHLMRYAHEARQTA